jgi:hypothetical protein
MPGTLDTPLTFFRGSFSCPRVLIVRKKGALGVPGHGSFCRPIWRCVCTWIRCESKTLRQQEAKDTPPAPKILCVCDKRYSLNVHDCAFLMSPPQIINKHSPLDWLFRIRTTPKFRPSASHILALYQRKGRAEAEAGGYKHQRYRRKRPSL